MKNKNQFVSISVWIFFLILAGVWVYTAKLKPTRQSGVSVFSGNVPVANQVANQVAQKTVAPIAGLEESVTPSVGVVLPATWGDLGLKLVNAGVIDEAKFKAIYEQRGTFSNENKNLLLGTNNGKLKITKENSGYLLNLLWALGLSNKNDILDTGEMVNKSYGGAGNFASTGGWTISKGKAMDHYSKYKFLTLTAAQQALVDKISRGIFRPCCGNSTHFPDCNHGMAMLGLLELMASQGASEQAMWNAALTVNSYWFPDTYLTIATFMNNTGVEWKDVNPMEMLGSNYSSSKGYARIAAQTPMPQQAGASSGGGCGIDTGSSAASAPTAAPVQQQSGCGL